MIYINIAFEMSRLEFIDIINSDACCIDTVVLFDTDEDVIRFMIDRNSLESSNKSNVLVKLSKKIINVVDKGMGLLIDHLTKPGYHVPTATETFISGISEETVSDKEEWIDLGDNHIRKELDLIGTSIKY